MPKLNLPSLTTILLVACAPLGIITLLAATTPPSRNASPQITEAYAKAQIIGDNYTDVTDLARSTGGWTAKAKESGQPVSLTVDNFGNVQKQ